MNRIYAHEGQPPVEQYEIANKVFEDALKKARLDTGLLNIDCSKAVDGYNKPPSEPQAVVDWSVRICQPANGVWPEEVLIRYGLAHDPPLLYPPDDGGVDWSKLQTEMCAKRPIISVVRNQYDWTPDGYHTWTIRGYHLLSDGTQMVEYHDPGADGTIVLSFDKWFNGVPNSFSHEVDYLNIRK